MSSVVDLLHAVRRIDNEFSISVDKIHSSSVDTATTVHAVENVIFYELFLALFGVIVAERRPCSDSRRHGALQVGVLLLLGSTL